MVRTFAAIDVGSFELELGIFEVSAKTGVRSIDYVKHMIALGRDTYNDGKISYRLVEEMCEVLEDFVRIMREYQVEDYRAYATSAMREAKNSEIVLDQIRVRTGIDIRIISNSEQRFIGFKAMAARGEDFPQIIQTGTAIVDAGFGSMQVSLFDKDALAATQNIPLGILKLREMVMHMRGTTAMEQNLTTEIVDNELVTFRKMYLKGREIKNLIGIGDSILNIYYKLELDKKGGRVTAKEFNQFYEWLGRMTLDQMEEAFDINADYASMLFPAATIFKRIMDLTGAETMWVPGVRLVDGIAADYAEEQKLLRFSHDFTNDIIVTARNMARRYKSHMPHTQEVEAEALKVFDSLKKIHGMKERERLLLQIAANLHSCGKFITMKDSTDCSYNIIMATELIGLSHLEREIVADVVRYHLQDFSYNEVEMESKPGRNIRLTTPDKPSLLVAKLTAILRLANSMDRSHRGKLATSKVAVKDKKLVITTDYDGDITFEALSIEQKADFFEEIFGIRPVLKQKKKV